MSGLGHRLLREGSPSREASVPPLPLTQSYSPVAALMAGVNEAATDPRSPTSGRAEAWSVLEAT
jgi:hypothetical protein